MVKHFELMQSPGELKTSNISEIQRVSVLEVHLLVDAPKNWVSEVNRGHSAFVKIMDVKGTEKPGQVQDFVEISSSNVKADKLISALNTSETIKNIDLVSLDHHRILGMITTTFCPVCSTLSGLSCSLLSATTRQDGKMEWKLLISGNDTVKAITDRLSEQGIGCTITQMTPLKSKKELTAKQEQIARIALEQGYFEFPKKIKLEELASNLGISPGNLSEILRRAEKNILTKYFSGY